MVVMLRTIIFFSLFLLAIFACSGNNSQKAECVTTMSKGNADTPTGIITNVCHSDSIVAPDDTMPDSVQILYTSYASMTQTLFALNREKGTVAQINDYNSYPFPLKLTHYHDRIMEYVVALFITKEKPIIEDSVYTGIISTDPGSALKISILYKDSVINHELGINEYAIPGYKTKFTDYYKSFYNLIECIHDYVTRMSRGDRSFDPISKN